MKRKSGKDSALTNNNTPTESIDQGGQFAAQMKGTEDPARGANRNSKHGRQGK